MINIFKILSVTRNSFLVYEPCILVRLSKRLLATSSEQFSSGDGTERFNNSVNLNKISSKYLTNYRHNADSVILIVTLAERFLRVV